MSRAETVNCVVVIVLSWNLFSTPTYLDTVLVLNTTHYTLPDSQWVPSSEYLLTLSVGIRPIFVVATASVLVAVVLPVVRWECNLAFASSYQLITEAAFHGHAVSAPQLSTQNLVKMRAVGVANSAHNLKITEGQRSQLY